MRWLRGRSNFTDHYSFSEFPSALLHGWLGDRKDICPVNLAAIISYILFGTDRERKT